MIGVLSPAQLGCVLNTCSPGMRLMLRNLRGCLCPPGRLSLRPSLGFSCCLRLISRLILGPQAQCCYPGAQGQWRHDTYPPCALRAGLSSTSKEAGPLVSLLSQPRATGPVTSGRVPLISTSTPLTCRTPDRKLLGLDSLG